MKTMNELIELLIKNEIVYYIHDLLHFKTDFECWLNSDKYENLLQIEYLKNVNGQWFGFIYKEYDDDYIKVLVTDDVLVIKQKFYGLSDFISQTI